MESSVQRSDFVDRIQRRFVSSHLGNSRRCDVCGAQYTTADNCGAWQCRGLQKDHYNKAYDNLDKGATRIPIMFTQPGSKNYHPVHPDAVVERVELAEGERSYLTVARSRTEADRLKRSVKT